MTTSPLDLCKKYYDKMDQNVCAAVLPNSICIVSITSKHRALQSGPIKSLKYLFDRPWRKNIHSKEKFKSIKINAGTQLCEIIAGDGTSHIIKSPVKGEIRELNERVLSNLTLLDSSSESSGYLALVLSKAKHLQQDIERLTEEQVSHVDEDDIENRPPPSNKENIEVLDENTVKENVVNNRKDLINQLIEVRTLETSAEENVEVNTGIGDSNITVRNKENDEAKDDISTLEKEETISFGELNATAITIETISKESTEAVSEKKTLEEEDKQCHEQNEEQSNKVVTESANIIDDCNVETGETIEPSKSVETESISEASKECEKKEEVKSKSRRRKTIGSTDNSGSDDAKTTESVRSTRSKRRKTDAVIGAEDAPPDDQIDEANKNTISADEPSFESVDIEIKASSVVESEPTSKACNQPLEEKSLAGGRRRRTVDCTALSESEKSKSLIKEGGTRSKLRKTVATEATESVVTEKENKDRGENEETITDRTVESNEPNPSEENNDEGKIATDIPHVESAEPNVVQSEKEKRSNVESNEAKVESEESVKDSLSEAADIEAEAISEVSDSVVEKRPAKGRRRKTIASTDSSGPDSNKSSREERSKRSLRRRTVASSVTVRSADTEEEVNDCAKNNTNVIDSKVESGEPNTSEEKSDEEKMSIDVPLVESVEPNTSEENNVKEKITTDVPPVESVEPKVVQSEKEERSNVESNDGKVESEESVKDSLSEAADIEAEAISDVSDSVVEKKPVKGRRRKTIASTESSGPELNKSSREERSKRSLRRRTVASSETVGSADTEEEVNDCAKNNTNVIDSKVESVEPNTSEENNVEEKIATDVPPVESVEPNVAQSEKEEESNLESNVSKDEAIDESEESVKDSISEAAVIEPEPISEVSDSNVEKKPVKGKRRKTIASIDSSGPESNKSSREERSKRSLRRKTVASSEPVLSADTEDEVNECNKNDTSVIDSTDETSEPNPSEDSNDEEKISIAVPPVESVDPNVTQSEKEEKSNVESTDSKDEANVESEESVKDSLSETTVIEAEPISEVSDSVVEKKPVKGRRRKTIASTESSEPESNKSSREEKSKRNLRRKTVASSEPVRSADIEEEVNDCNESNTSVIDRTVETSEPNPSKDNNDEEKIATESHQVESVEPNVVQTEKEEKNNVVESTDSKDEANGESEESVKDILSETAVIEAEPISEVSDSVVEKKPVKGRRRKTIASTESSGPESNKSSRDERSKRSLRRKTVASSEPVESVNTEEEIKSCSKNNTSVIDSTVESGEQNTSEEKSDEEKIAIDVPPVESVEPNVVPSEKEERSNVESNEAKVESEESVKDSLSEAADIEAEAISEVSDSVVEKKPAKGRRRKTVASTDSSGPEPSQEERSKRSLRRKTVASSEPVGSVDTEEEVNECNKNNISVIDSTVETNEQNSSEEKSDEEKIATDVPQVESVEPNVAQSEKEEESNVDSNYSKDEANDESEKSVNISTSEPADVESGAFSKPSEFDIVESESVEGGGGVKAVIETGNASTSDENEQSSLNDSCVNEEIQSEVSEPSLKEEKVTRGSRRKTITATESDKSKSLLNGRRGTRKSRRQTIAVNENVKETESVITEGESKDLDKDKITDIKSNTEPVEADISEIPSKSLQQTIEEQGDDSNKDKIAELDDMPERISSEEKDDEKIIFLSAPTIELNESDNAEEKHKDTDEKIESAVESKETDSAVNQKKTSSATAESEANEAIVDKTPPRGRRRRTIAATESIGPGKEIEARPTRSKRRKTLATAESTVENKSGKSLEEPKSIDSVISNLENESEQISAATAADAAEALESLESDFIEKNDPVKDGEEGNVDFSRSEENKEIFKQTPLRQKWLKVTNLTETNETVIVSDGDFDIEEGNPDSKEKKVREKRRKTIDTVQLSDSEDFEDLSATRAERSKRRRKTIAGNKLTEKESSTTCVIDSPNDTFIERKTSRGRVIQTIPVINLSDEDTDKSTSPAKRKKSVTNKKSPKKDNKNVGLSVEHPSENIKEKKTGKEQETKPTRLRKR